MKALLYKEFRLVTHPTTVLFLLLSAMLLIPNYPLYVTFFYCTLGIFFACLGGRENGDVFYTVLQPIQKCDAVRARILFAVVFESAQLILAALFSLLRIRLLGAQNAAGMDANLALFGFSLLLLGVFNVTFFPLYYRNPAKVGKSFAVAAAILFLGILILESLCFILPIFKEKLDTPDLQFFPEKCFVLLFGAIFYVGLTFAADKIAERRFAQLDV